MDYQQLATDIKQWAYELGFQQCGICDTDLSEDEQHLLNWLDQGFHGDMDYMQRHGTRRSRPHELIEGTTRIISVRMDYLRPNTADSEAVIDNPQQAFISRYALGRDYHKVIRRRLQKLAKRIEAVSGPFGYRAFVDSAPVLEKAIAQKAGLGWIGKHSNLLNSRSGSWFFLGELYTDLPLPVDAPATDHCGTCTRCLDICPTQAIVAPNQVDARLCISYLTIELHGPIPEPLRAPMGNRVYGCDDCQIVCPWNKFSRPSELADFEARHGLDSASLLSLFQWDEQTFLKNTEGSAIRRIGYQRWLRNLAVGLGNGPTDSAVIDALSSALGNHSDLVDEHIRWALEQLTRQSSDKEISVPAASSGSTAG